MQSIGKYFFLATGYGLAVLALLAGLCWRINGVYAPNSHWQKVRTHLLSAVYLASPAIVPAGRNIAFESGNAVANAPASYLTMLDCCESDEAIADRIKVGQTQCRIIRSGFKTDARRKNDD